MIYSRILFTLLVSLSLFLTVFNETTFSADLHAIVIADTSDSSVGTSVEIDYKNVTTLMKKIAQNSDMPLKMTTFRDKDVKLKKIVAHLKSLRLKRDDTVIFYYAGHGFRNKNVKSKKWPALALKDSEDDFVGLELQTVYDILKKKNPRFLLVISDSCNNVIEGINVMSSKTTRDLPNKENYIKLFRKYKGAILASGAKPGQIALGDTSRGGVFTSKFFQVLNDAFQEKNPTWKNILKKATVKLGKQEPQYDTFGLKIIEDKKVVIIDPKKDKKDDGIVVIPYSTTYGKNRFGGRKFKTYGGKDRILVGFNIWHSTIVNAIQPIYRKLNKNGTLGYRTYGPKYGGYGGRRSRVMKRGYVATNIWVMEVDYYGNKVIGAIVLDYMKWNKGYLNKVFSRSKIYGKTAAKKWKLYNRYKGTIICGIHGRYGRYLNRLSLLVTQRGYRKGSISAKKPLQTFVVNGSDTITIRMYNVDDYMYLYVNNRLVKTATKRRYKRYDRYNRRYRGRGFDRKRRGSAWGEGPRYFDISPYLKRGRNQIKIRVYNRRGKWSYGYRIYKNNNLLVKDRCGRAGRTSCWKNMSGRFKVVQKFSIIKR